MRWRVPRWWTKALRRVPIYSQIQCERVCATLDVLPKDWQSNPLIELNLDGSRLINTRWARRDWSQGYQYVPQPMTALRRSILSLPRKTGT